MSDDYTGKRIGTCGELIVSGEETKIYIPAFKKTLVAKGLDNCQSVYGNNIIFIGTFLDKDTIEIHEADDLPCEDIMDEINRLFVSVINYKDIYMSAFRTELCSVRMENDLIMISCMCGGEKVKTYIEKPEEIKKDEDSLSNYLISKGSVMLLTATDKNVIIDRDNKVITFNNAKKSYI